MLWENFVHKYAPDTDLISLIREEYRCLQTKLSQPRFYHSINHIENGFKNCPMCEDKDIGWAWIFHDIFYDPYFDNNEIESGYQAFIYLTTHADMDGYSAGNIFDIIQGTNHNNPNIKMYDQRLIHDIDLSELAVEYSVFCYNTDLVREEFFDTSCKDFVSGRINFMRKLLNNQIFLTDEFSHLEEKARLNMMMWIAENESKIS